MTVIPAYTTLQPERSALKLARYAQLIGYDERAFFGLNFPGIERRACRQIWTLEQRAVIARYLWEAQFEIEQQVGYPLQARWIGDNLGLDEQPARPLALARYKHVIEAGIRATSVIEGGAVLDHTADPATATATLADGIPAGEIHVFHPGTDVEIPVSEISITEGPPRTVTIKIPRARLVDQEHSDNPSNGWDYTDTSDATGPFLQEVDIVRVYNDSSRQAVLVYPHVCNAFCLSDGCAATVPTETACIKIVAGQIGTLEIRPTNGRWVGYGSMQLYYRCGLPEMTAQAEDAVMRLAHSKMPDEPCGCDPVRDLWGRDRSVPETLTRERINCRFGLSDGAWIAWQFTQSMQLHRMRVL